MKRLYISLLVLLPLALVAQKKYTGEEHGLKVSTYAAPLFPGDPGLTPSLEGSSTYRGYSAGVSLLLPKSEKWYWQLGLQASNIEWTLKSGKLEWGSTADSLPDRIRYIDDYFFLGLPVGIRYTFNPGKKLKLYAHPSLQANFITSAKRHATILYRNGFVEEEASSVDLAGFRRFNLRAELGLGLEWQIYPTAALFAEPHYFHHALADAEQARFQAWGIYGGIVFKL